MQTGMLDTVAVNERHQSREMVQSSGIEQVVNHSCLEQARCRFLGAGSTWEGSVSARGGASGRWEAASFL